MFSFEPDGYDCPVCRIVAGFDNEPPWTVQEEVVFRDDATTAFISAKFWGRNEGHVIVVPNEHSENIFTLSPEVAARVHTTAQRCATALVKAYDCPGISTRQHNGPAGNQEVWHYHLHVFPRFDGDGLYGAQRRIADVDERLAYARKLKAQL